MSFLSNVCQLYKECKLNYIDLKYISMMGGTTHKIMSLKFIFPEYMLNLPFITGSDNISHIITKNRLNTIEIGCDIQYEQDPKIYKIMFTLNIQQNKDGYSIKLLPIMRVTKIYSCLTITCYHDNHIFLNLVSGIPRCFQGDNLLSDSFGYIYMMLCHEFGKKLKFDYILLKDESITKCDKFDISLLTLKLLTTCGSYYTSFGYKPKNIGNSSISQQYSHFVDLMNSPISGNLKEEDPISKFPEYQEKLKYVCSQYLDKLPIDKLASNMNNYLSYIVSHKTESHIKVNNHFIKQDCFYSFVIDVIYRECMLFDQNFVEAYVGTIRLFKNDEMYLNLK